jgi:glycerol uptake facilitator-like aquaporin
MSARDGDTREAAPLGRRVAAEGLGAAFLLMAIVGSGIMAERLMKGDAGPALLVNSIATGAALTALIIALGPISGAHFNPVVTLSFAMRQDLAWKDASGYFLAQFAGGFVGVALANVMFQEPVFLAAGIHRPGSHLWLGELIASFGLVAVILSTARRGSLVVAPSVGCYVTSAYWFTSSTSFANPAVTLARAATDTFTGIHAGSVSGFIAAQCLGAVAATALMGWLTASPRAATNPTANEVQNYRRDMA